MVPEIDRSAAQGLKQFFTRAFGFLLGPILFGAIIDSYCVVSRDGGSCWLYDLHGYVFQYCFLVLSNHILKKQVPKFQHISVRVFVWSCANFLSLYMVVDLTYSEVEPVFTEIKYFLPFRIIQKENRSRSKHVNQKSFIILPLIFIQFQYDIDVYDESARIPCSRNYLYLCCLETVSRMRYL